MEEREERVIAPSRIARTSQIAPTQVEQTHTHQKKRTRKFCSNLFAFLFSLHLLLIFILTIILTVHGLLNHHIRPSHWYPPLLTSSLCAVPVAFAWLVAIHRHPAKTIKAAFWLGPTLTFAASLLLLSTDTNGGLIAAAFGIIFALAQTLYACWVNRRRDYAAHVLALSLSATQSAAGITQYVVLALLAGIIYSTIWISGVGNTAGIRFSPIYVVALFVSLAWTKHVIRNVLHVSIARVAHAHFTESVAVDTRVAVRDAVTGLFGSVCLGSALVPVTGLFRGLARAVNLCAGDVDEFMFSCAHCYMGVADRLVTYGNRWGFVHVGVHDEGIVRTSGHTWELFARAGMVPLIDSDLTGSICFLCGVAGGALSAIAAGSWAFVVHRGYATSAAVCAFWIGYFMNRIALSWPQACVSAYHVAYAENPQSHRFDSTIPDRIRALQPSQA
ncbi:hypothetical protein MRB53_018413 [Persea americana]|uniref:Uncharacterized protein n=1 Tax=Persea americana TaxID=3435 RepID=A0ACC2M7Y7_PERAE|nr:hypothetical protein MRB53_018413 [Persea americana]